jgi:hypothetical protein
VSSGQSRADHWLLFTLYCPVDTDKTMTEDVEGRRRKWRRLWLALAVLAAILIVLIVPPLVSISRYKSQITQLMAASLGRPVRLASVELRLLPRPGFVLTDLAVEEDPAFGAEPVLHANKVVASFRLLSLWRGRLEISRVSVDEASLNLVRTGGRWNLDSLFRTAAAQAGPGAGLHGALQLPYLEATNSRINIKNGAEKLPFSLIATDLSFWQDEPGDWRIRLRGQPARTDLSLDLADTGVVRLEASARRAPELRQMPVHLDLIWREAQLGQLTRLVIGSDPGWRGDLTGELHLDGTADAAQIKTRLRATGVHRAEFAPAAPMDFDARCGFVYHYSRRSLNNLACDSPLGDGHIHLTGEMPGDSGRPYLSVQFDRVPVAAGLDALRTVRSDFGPGLEAEGTISGEIAYAEEAAAASAEKPGSRANAGNPRSAKPRPTAPGPLTGSLTVDGFQLSGDALSTPIRFSKVVLEPVAASPGQPAALTATVAIPSAGAGSLTVVSELALSGYRVAVHGQATLARARELAHVAGMENAAALDALAGGPVAVDLSAEGPWIPVQRISLGNIPSTGAPVRAAIGPPAPSPAADEAATPGTDSITGTVVFHNANWKADYLANHVEISAATLHLDNGETRWDPVVFNYGPLKGTAKLAVPASCDAMQPCPAHFDIEFGNLAAASLQAAVLGAHERGTLLSALIARLRLSNPSSVPAWPPMEGTVKADSLILGPVTLRQPSATVRILPAGAQITALDAGFLGGRMHGEGTLSTGDKPFYSLQAHFEKLNPAAVGPLLGLRCSGSGFDADGQVDLSGYAEKDLAASAKGSMHFVWRRGGMAAAFGSGAVPPALARFERWTADAVIANGAITLKQNQVQQGAGKREVEGAVTLGASSKATFTVPKQPLAKGR